MVCCTCNVIIILRKEGKYFGFVVDILEARKIDLPQLYVKLLRFMVPNSNSQVPVW